MWQRCSLQKQPTWSLNFPIVIPPVVAQTRDQYTYNYKQSLTSLPLIPYHMLSSAWIIPNQGPTATLVYHCYIIIDLISFHVPEPIVETPTVQAALHIWIHNCSPFIDISHNHSSLCSMDILLASNAFFLLFIQPIPGLPHHLTPSHQMYSYLKSPNTFLPLSTHA